MNSIETDRLNLNMARVRLPACRDASSPKRGIRKNISIPGLLAPALRLRTQEFGHRTLSPFAVDLVCYDLRSNGSHAITLAIARDTQAAQLAVDAEIVARYKPGQPRNGLLVQFIEHLNGVRIIARRGPEPVPLRTEPERITIPAAIWPLADSRWRELGYASFSAYITGLSRYDLLLGGPHLFRAGDSRRDVQAALDRETLAARERGQSRKLFLDYLIERVQGRSLTSIELDPQKTQIANQLLKHVRPDFVDSHRARVGPISR
jgi:hypothetical protein